MCFVHIGFSQDYYLPLGNSKSDAAVIDNSYSNLKMLFTIQGLSGKQVTAKTGQNFTELYFGNGYYIGEIGTPKLPAFKRLIQIPFGAEVDVKVIGYSKEVYSLSEMGITNQLFPVQPSLRKDMDETDVPFEYDSKVYKTSGFQNRPIAKVEVLGTMRGVRIARVEVAAVDYDAVKGTIMVYNDIEVDIVFNGTDRSLNESIRAKTYSPYFESTYAMLANPFNKDVYDDHPDLTNYPIKMLIVSNRMFEATLAPYIAWKTKKGFNVEVAYTDVIGTSSAAIQTFVHNKYNNATTENPAPSFLIFVGDVEQVPASATGSSSQKKTDLYYGSVDGDYFPEMYYGRFSATSPTQLTNIINKILYYEQYQFADPNYLNNATLIAGVDGTWNPRVAQPTIKYGTANYFNAAHGFNTVWGYGVANDPNNPNNSSGYTGCYDNARISVSLINYTAHCSETSWGDPNLSISAVNAFTNANKYPLAVGNCCLAADFGYGECIGEAWLRGANKGAVTYIGSSPSSYWFEDFYWAVGAFPIVGNNDGYVPTYEETTIGMYDAPFNSNYICAGGLVFAGNLAVTEVDIQNYPSHSSPLYYWQAYNVLGDPSLIPYLTTGETNTVSHMAIVPIGMNTYTVAALPGSYVAISKDGILHGAALVDASGEVEVAIQPILSGGNVDIVVTRPQTVPYSVQVPAAALEGPYIVLDNFVVNDQNGNNNGQADFGETISLHVTLKNVGADNGTGITASVTGTDPYFTVTSGGPASFGTIAAGETGNTVTVNNAFAFTVANNVPDQHQATFTLSITDSEDTWQSNLKIIANAPVLSIGGITIDDGGLGIPGILDPGETADAVIQVSNVGHASAPSISALLTTASPYVTINGNATINLGPLAVGATAEAVYSVTADMETPLETAATFNLSLTAGQYTASKNLQIIIGYIPEYNMGSSPTVTACIGRFYDSGGLGGSYASSENYTMTFLPANASATLMFVFSQFSTENNYDKLFIYDGTSTSAPQFPGSPFMGTVSPGTIMATNPQGAITFVFTSDGSVTQAGWVAEFHCVDLSVPPPCAGNPNPTNGAIVGNSPYTLTWGIVPGATQYDVYFGAGTLPAQPNATVTTNAYSVTVVEYTSYVWKVVPKNNSGPATGCPTWHFTTQDIAVDINIHNGTITTCNAMLYDSGGPSGDYSNSENKILTVYPSQLNAMVKVSFISFNLESNWDFLKIFDGTSTSATQLANLTGTTLPGNYVATNAAGALTFQFTSDGSVVRPGFEAYLSCEGGLNTEAEILTFDFEEDVVVNVVISPVLNNEASIEVTVTLGTDISSLTPTLTISEGATLFPQGGVSMDFTNPVTFTITSEDGSRVNVYTVNVFEELPYYTLTLNANPTGGGNIAGAGNYLEGAVVNVSAVANSGYEFVNWTGAGGVEVSTLASFVYTMPAADITLTANFIALPTYSLTLVANPVEGGTVSGAGNYVEGLSVAVTATPEAGYVFVDWQKDGVAISTLPTFNFTMPSEDVTLTANFSAIINFAVTFNVDMSTANDFNPETDVVYITGSLLGWATPGDDAENQTMTQVEGTMIWTITHNLDAGNYEYKYFMNAGWDNGEWAGGANRVIDVNADMIINDIWGIPNYTDTNVLENLSIFPNPFSNYINIDNPDVVKRVIITNIVGQVVMNKLINGNGTINTTELGNGLYLITIEAHNGERSIRKMVKQ